MLRRKSFFWEMDFVQGQVFPEGTLEGGTAGGF
jgi:hypothetical protein